jgi:hypothetical protein
MNKLSIEDVDLKGKRVLMRSEVILTNKSEGLIPSINTSISTVYNL